MRHVLVISQYFYPEQFRINDLCAEWVRRGYRVTVVTGIPNYPYGEFFEGYSWFKKRKETYKGINIIRLPLVPRGKGALQLAANYLSFVVSGWAWKSITRIKADCVFIFEVSPMTQALTGVWYAKKNRVPCYLYVQDLWPENVEVVAGIHNPLIIQPINRMVDYIYKSCAHIFATSPSFAEKIRERGELPDKVSYWPQYAEECYRPLKREIQCKDEKLKKAEQATAGKFTIVFAGNIGYAQGLDILPRAAELLKSKPVCFLIVGSGRYMEEFKRELKIRDVETQFFLAGQRRQEEVPRYLALADTAFVSFLDDPLFKMTIPAKLQSYMACKKPILAAADGETKRIIEEANCGICCPIGDEKRLAEQIQRLMACKDLEQMGINALEYSETHFNKKTLLDEMEQYLRGEKR